MFIRMCKNDKGMILSKESRLVNKNWSVSELTMEQMETRTNVCKDNSGECEHVTEMIRELSCGINGFSLEITDSLAYISTNQLYFNTKLH